MKSNIKRTFGLLILAVAGFAVMQACEEPTKQAVPTGPPYICAEHPDCIAQAKRQDEEAAQRDAGWNAMQENQQLQPFDASAAENCVKWIRGNAMHPSTVDLDWETQTIHAVRTIIVHKGFSAENSFDMRAHYVATCSSVPATGEFIANVVEQ
jgi:hypothetical protein